MLWPINFKKGSIPGKKRKPDEEKKEVGKNTKAKKLYKEQRVARTFNENWTKGNPWLLHNNEGITCSV